MANYNRISLPRDFIYEFQGDKTLIGEYREKCILNNVEFYKTNKYTSAAELGYPVLKDDKVFDWIIDCLNQVGSNYFNFADDYKLIICDAWLTRTNFLNVGQSHFHSLSIFSGLLYLQDSDVETVFTVQDEFYKRHNDFLSYIFKPKLDNTYKIKPQCGKLIIWPSYVYHNIAVNKQKDVRYTLAFNSFFDGTLSTTPTGKLIVKTTGV